MNWNKSKIDEICAWKIRFLKFWTTEWKITRLDYDQLIRALRKTIMAD